MKIVWFCRKADRQVIGSRDVVLSNSLTEKASVGSWCQAISRSLVFNLSWCRILDQLALFTSSPISPLEPQHPELEKFHMSCRIPLNFDPLTSREHFTFQFSSKYRLSQVQISLSTLQFRANMCLHSVG